jgi:magnesium chelatase family protein
MSFAKVYSAQNFGLDAHIIDIEVDILKGLHSFSIVGLPDKAVEESRDRVSAAVKNSGYTSPKKKNQKVVISLAPARLKKEGPNFDLGIALAYLLAVGDIKFNTKNKLFLGELSLDGTLRPIKGVLPLVLEAREKGFEEIYVPVLNGEEAALVDAVQVYAVSCLKEVVTHLTCPQNAPQRLLQLPATPLPTRSNSSLIDFSHVKGQEVAKRGLLIAAAGGHNIAMYGPPGTGKTLLARAFPSILPELTFDEMLEVTSIHSIVGENSFVADPPFRSPHHTSSHVSIIGGGAVPKPGEATLAHRGVLFLDEFPEFDRRVVESLRQPLEDKEITVARAHGTSRFPADFILIAALNPCPCGFFGSNRECSCSPGSLEKYRRKLSGPIIDRIDVWVEVSAVSHEKLANTEDTAPQSTHIREIVKKARKIQSLRLKESGARLNTNMNSKNIDTLANMNPTARNTLIQAAERLYLSGRSHHRIIKIARTIADLEENETIEENHILEAIQYRPKQIQ